MAKPETTMASFGTIAQTELEFWYLPWYRSIDLSEYDQNCGSREVSKITVTGLSGVNLEYKTDLPGAEWRIQIEVILSCSGEAVPPEKRSSESFRWWLERASDSRFTLAELDRLGRTIGQKRVGIELAWNGCIVELRTVLSVCRTKNYWRSRTIIDHPLIAVGRTDRITTLQRSSANTLFSYQCSRTFFEGCTNARRFHQATHRQGFRFYRYRDWQGHVFSLVKPRRGKLRRTSRRTTSVIHWRKWSQRTKSWKR